jgi:hypothetical protein
MVRSPRGICRPGIGGDTFVHYAEDVLRISRLGKLPRGPHDRALMLDDGNGATSVAMPSR